MTTLALKVAVAIKAGGGGLPPGGGGGDPFDQLRRYFGQGGQREYKQHGLGSGVIVSADGYILTNNHVVGNADEIHVTLQDKREFTAKVIGKDAKTDLGLIKIDTKDALPVAPLGDSNTTDVGDWVIAIGNPVQRRHDGNGGHRQRQGTNPRRRLRRFHSDRRVDQSRQLGRAADQHERRSYRDQHGDLQPHRRQQRHRLRYSRSTWRAT